MKIFVLLFSIFSASLVFAEDSCPPVENPLREHAGEISRSSSDSELGPLAANANGENNEWMGVGAFKGPDGTTCTVNLIEPPGDCPINDSAPAVVVANGHCVGIATKGDNVRNNEAFEADISFNHFADTTGKQVKAKVDRLIYANMTTKDLSVMRLNLTYGDLRKAGVKPFKVARKFEPGEMQSMAIPTNGVANDQQFIRQNKCQVGARADVMESTFVWRDQLAFSCPAVGGSSGSGLFNPRSRELMGLMNTGNKEDDPKNPSMPCRYNGPCDITDGIQPTLDRRYGLDVTFLHDCVKSCEFSPSEKNCPLPSQPQASPLVSSPTNDLSKPIMLEIPGREPRFQSYKVKMGPAGSTDCAEPSGYTESKSSYFPPRTKAAEGAYVLCVFGQNKNGQWQSPREARTVGMRLDTTPPVSALLPTPTGKGSHYLSVSSKSSSDPLTGFVYKFASRPSDCANKKQGYVKPPVQWRGNKIQTEGHSNQVVCVLGYDMAGNQQSEATVYQIP